MIAKHRIMAERNDPRPMPVDIPVSWARITVQRSVNGRLQTETVFMDSISGNSYRAYDEATRQALGVIGINQALRDMSKRFPMVRKNV